MCPLALPWNLFLYLWIMITFKSPCVCWWSAVQTKHPRSLHQRHSDLQQQVNLPPKTTQFTRQRNPSTPNAEQWDVFLFQLTHQSE